MYVVDHFPKSYKVKTYKTILLPVVLYGCETWSITLREKQMFRVFENKLLRKICGTKRDKITGEWRKLYIVDLYALYSSPNITKNFKLRRLRWAGHVACSTYGAIQKCIQSFSGKT